MATRNQADSQDPAKALKGFKISSLRHLTRTFVCCAPPHKEQALPGQTLSKDRAAFEAALVALRARELAGSEISIPRFNHDFK